MVVYRALSLLFWITLSSKIVTWMSLWARIGQPVSGNGSSVFVSHTTQCNPWSHLCREAYRCVDCHSHCYTGLIFTAT
ncbi:hypothetical protein B0H19DRAFT_1193638 [Mycena capillaripes]|nr:hypothetical protein B0H19DRAFT_1193638 [Mycena capillaripes]